MHPGIRMPFSAGKTSRSLSAFAVYVMEWVWRWNCKVKWIDVLLASFVSLSFECSVIFTILFIRVAGDCHEMARDIWGGIQMRFAMMMSLSLMIHGREVFFWFIQNRDENVVAITSRSSAFPSDQFQTEVIYVTLAFDHSISRLLPSIFMIFWSQTNVRWKFFYYFRYIFPSGYSFLGFLLIINLTYYALMSVTWKASNSFIPSSFSIASSASA